MPEFAAFIAGLYFDNEMAGKRSQWGISHKGKDLATTYLGPVLGSLALGGGALPFWIGV